MSIVQSNSVDFIGTDTTTGSIVLTISDDLTWENENQHLSLLQAKLNTYLAFVESGEIADRYPTAHDKEIRIDIVLQYPLSDKAMIFLHKVQPVVQRAGIGLSRRILKVSTTPETNSQGVP